jgi:adenine nucleotide transporter 17
MGDERIASEVISASLGGAISAAVLYPLEVLKTKLQAETKPPPPTPTPSLSTDAPTHNKPSWTMWQYAQHVGATEGYQVFVHGFETSAFQSAMEKALYFFAYTILKQVWRHWTNEKPLNTWTNLLLGCAAEWCHLPITLPLDCWTTYIQTHSQNSTTTTTTTTTTTNKNHGPLAMFLALLSEKGWAGLYKGWQTYYVLCFKPALQYTVFEQVKTMVLQQRRLFQQLQQQQQQHSKPLSLSNTTSLGAMESFLLGMLARVVATVLTFPYVRAKVVLQTQSTTNDTNSSSSDGNNNNKTITTSIPNMLWHMYQEHGLASWFQGIGPELTRGMLSAALMLMIKEQLYTIVDHALYGNATVVALPSVSTTKQQQQQPPSQQSFHTHSTNTTQHSS